MKFARFKISASDRKKYNLDESKSTEVFQTVDESAIDRQPDYVFKPNDPFNHQIDSVEASTRISAHQKSWVRKSWFFLNIIFPYMIFIILSFAFIAKEEGDFPIGIIGFFALITVGATVPYIIIWKRKC